MAVEYLRLSLTDRCNLNCVYCTPREKRAFLPHADLLRHEELARAAAAFVRLGVRKIRLTGGEPLLKKNLTGLVRMLRAIPGLEELALTTNGLLLAPVAAELKAAGLDRVNISLDTLKPAAFREITGHDGLERVLAGVDAALAAGLAPVKINTVLLKGVNSGEAADFARLTLERPLTVRFIEYFPANGRSAGLGGALFSTAETRAAIEAAFGPLEPAPAGKADGPARVYRLTGAKGAIGFISGRSDYFCRECNRVRMDCTGRVYPCLFSPHTHDLGAPLRAGASEAELAALLEKAFLVKSRYRKDSATAGHVEMSDIGG